jgi:hypothetical protein
VKVLFLTKPKQANNVWIALEKEPNCFLQAVEHDVKFVGLQTPVLPAGKSNVILRRGDHEAHQIDVIDRVRLNRW